ncbi:MAG: FkbM family methyltransferase [Hyphomicrobiales bacterium]|nr:MAG: FkbM family methyltransferase [Hyphomicrobiales bacterium]
MRADGYSSPVTKEATLFKIASILPAIEPIKVVDVGAMSLGEENDVYANLARSASVEVVGFEPVAAELEKLRALHPIGRTYLPYAIGDGGRHTFHECNFPMTSSLLEPNHDLVNRFQALGELMQVVSSTEMDTRRLDDIPEVAGTDFLKLDVQGAELMILKGGERLLDDVLVVHTEVEFVPLYKDQPLFGDIDSYLRSRGFAFHKFTGIMGRAFKPLIYRDDVYSRLSQGLWSDTVYVRDFMGFDRLSTAKLLKLAAILHEVYKSIDLAALALSSADARDGTALQPAYLQALSRPNG